MADIDQAPVTISLTGLLLFRFDDNMQYCDVGVHNRAEDHRLKIRITETQGGATQSSQEFSENLRGGLLIDVNEPLFEGVRKHQFGEVLFREHPIPAQEKDFRWVIDLEGANFFDNKLKIDQGGLDPVIRFTNGLFYTFAKINKEIFKTVRRVGGGKPTLELFSIADKAGVNIYLKNSDSQVTLRNVQDGNSLAALKRPTPDTTYFIEITNLPPSCPNAGSDHGDHIGSHFKKYFDVIKGKDLAGRITPVEQFDLQFVKTDGTIIPPAHHNESQKKSAGDRQPRAIRACSQDVPCMAGCLGGGRP